MYQLYHSVPVVWRTERCVQFGIDEPILVDGLTPQDTELISVLRMGIGVDDFFERAEHLGVTAARASSLLALLDEAGVLTPVDASADSSRPTTHVDAYAASLQASPALIASALVDAPVLVTGPLAGALASGLRTAGFAVEAIDRAEDALDVPAPLVVLTGIWVEDAVTAAFLVENGIRHMQLVIGQSRATISHVIVPGATPCTSCAFHHRSDDDADWLECWRSLWRQSPAPVRTDPVLTALALAHTASVIRNAIITDPPVPKTTTVTMPSGATAEAPAEFHSACDCVIPVIGIVEETA